MYSHSVESVELVTIQVENFVSFKCVSNTYRLLKEGVCVALWNQNQVKTISLSPCPLASDLPWAHNSLSSRDADFVTWVQALL